MLKSLHSVFIVLVLGWGVLFAPAAQAVVTLPWSTTYNCPDWTQSDGVPSCDGLLDYGGGASDSGTAPPIWDGPDRVARGTSPAGLSYGSGDGTGWNTVMTAGATDPVTGL